MRTCPQCNETKTVDKFAKNDRLSSGYSNKCRDCVNARRREVRGNPTQKKKENEKCKKYYYKNQDYMKKKTQLYFSNNKEKYRNNDLIKKYNITLDDYDKMYAFQNGKCFICNNSHPSRGFDSLNVDHNHISQEVRGLLCKKCNQGLGLFNDNLEFLLKAASYLENPPTYNLLFNSTTSQRQSEL